MLSGSEAPMSKNSEKKILFTGDSITAAERNIQDVHYLGSGYVSLIADMFLTRQPDFNVKVINTGVSGNTISHLLTRFQDDVIEHLPDTIVILIGINDATRYCDESPSLCLSPEDFYQAYTTLVHHINHLLPDTEIILIPPFFLSRGHYNLKSYRAKLVSLVDEYAERVESLAAHKNTTTISLAGEFSRVLSCKPSAFLSGDRIHPNKTGHLLIADTIYEILRGKM